MKLVLLGTGGYHPSNQRQTACLMLPELGVLLDAGTAMFRARDLLQSNTLDIFLSHAHLDHVIGLTYLFDIVYDKPVEEIRVHGEREKLEQIAEHLFADTLFPAMPNFEMRPLGDDASLSDGAKVSYFPLEHPGGSVGFRIDWPKQSIAYVTDTTATADAAYIDKIRGVDILVHECYFPDELEDRAKLTGHSCAKSVGHVAREADAGLLILVHVNPLDLDADQDARIESQVKAVFPNAMLGTDMMEVES